MPRHMNTHTTYLCKEVASALVGVSRIRHRFHSVFSLRDCNTCHGKTVMDIFGSMAMFPKTCGAPPNISGCLVQPSETELVRQPSETELVLQPSGTDLVRQAAKLALVRTWRENIVPKLLGVRRPAFAGKEQWAVVHAQGQWSTVNDQRSMVSERCVHPDILACRVA